MAYVCPGDLDGFVPHLNKVDTKLRQQVGADLLEYLAEPSNSIACQDIGQLVDGLIMWMQSSNYKVCFLKFPYWNHSGVAVPFLKVSLCFCFCPVTPSLQIDRYF